MTSTDAPVTTRGTSGYRPDLDGIRALAILAVMAYHLSYVARGYRLTGGFLGVDVFFVLSGYLITTLLLQEIAASGGVKLNFFYARRVLRLYPALLLAIIFGAVVTATLHQQLSSRPYWQSALYAIFYVGNWANAHIRLGVIGHTWSLAIEEQYYLVWPFVLVFGLKILKSKRNMAVLALGGAAAVAAIRFVLFAHGHVNQAALWTVSRADGVLIGSALALLLVDAPRVLRAALEPRIAPIVAAVVLVGAAIMLNWESPALYRGGLLICNLSAAVVIGHLVLRPASVARRLLSMRPLPAIGRISYELYLFHVPMLYLIVGRPSRMRGLVPIVLIVVASFVVAIASYMVVDRPLVKVRKRFTPPRATPQPSVAG